MDDDFDEILDADPPLTFRVRNLIHVTTARTMDEWLPRINRTWEELRSNAQRDHIQSGTRVYVSKVFEWAREVSIGFNATTVDNVLGMLSDLFNGAIPAVVLDYVETNSRQSFNVFHEDFCAQVKERIDVSLHGAECDKVFLSGLGAAYRYLAVEIGKRRVKALAATKPVVTSSQRVFISYIREDSVVVDRLVAELRECGISARLDRKDISPGVFWKDAIHRAIRDGAFFLACFSSHSIARDRSHMNEEILLAIEELRLRPSDKAWFLPVKLDACDIPEIRLGPSGTLNDLQHVNLAENWTDGISRLVSAMRAKL